MFIEIRSNSITQVVRTVEQTGNIWREAGDVVTRKFSFLGMSRWTVSVTVRAFMGGEHQTCVNKPDLGGCGQEKSKLAQTEVPGTLT